MSEIAPTASEDVLAAIRTAHCTPASSTQRANNDAVAATENGVSREMTGERRSAASRSARGEGPIVKDAAVTAFKFMARFIVDESGAVMAASPSYIADCK